MGSPTLYIAGFDVATTQHEIVEVLSMSSPCLARCVLAPLAVSSQASLPTSTEHSLCVHITFHDPLAHVQFLDAPSTPPHLMTEAIGAVLALNGSKVVPRRYISSANSWSHSGLRVVLEPSHFPVLLQSPSLKSLVDAYPAVYSRYLSLDSLTSLRSSLSGQRPVAPTNRAMFATTSPLPPTPETPSTALECALSEDRPQTPPHGGNLRLASTPLLVPGSVPLLLAENEDQGMEGVKLAFQASQFSKVADPDVSSRQAELDTLEAQVADLRGRLHTVEETLEVTEVELARQNTEYMSVLGQLSEERKNHQFTLEEMEETFARKLQDAEQRARGAERLAKDAREELDAFKNDDRNATRLLRDAKFHERQCLKAVKGREQAEAELKKLRATYEWESREHKAVKMELALVKEARHGGKEIRDASTSLALENLGLPSGGLAAATQQLEQARAENQASINQLTAANARVTELELKLDSSEHNLAMRTSELKKSEQRLMSLTHHLADTADQVKAEQACSDKKLKAATELINELQEKKRYVEGALNDERGRFNELVTVHKQTIKDLDSQRADSSREINRLRDLQANVQAELKATRGELSCEKAKTTSISNERDEKQAMVTSLQLSLKNEREEGRVLEEDLAVERTKKRELEAELIESREKVKASEEENQKLQTRLNREYEAKQRLATEVKMHEAAGDSLRLDVLNGIRVYEKKKKRPISDVLDVDSSGQPTKRRVAIRSFGDCQ